MQQMIIISKEDLKSALCEITYEVQKPIIEQIFADIKKSQELLTFQQLSDYLQVSIQSIVNWIKRDADENPLPVYYVGADPRFSIEEVKKWAKCEAERKIKQRRNK